MEDNRPERRLGLLQATAINMTDMVGIGPFITLPMVIGMMNGPYFLYAWLAGAFLSFVDAMVWSELGAAFPKAGGSYNFLKETYGKEGLGKMMSFLFVWQTAIQAPLVVASGAIGFAQYLTYLVDLTFVQQKMVFLSGRPFGYDAGRLKQHHICGSRHTNHLSLMAYDSPATL